MYRDAIVEINAHPLVVPKSMVDQIRSSSTIFTFRPISTDDNLVQVVVGLRYEPELMDIIVPYLEDNCPNLHRITCGLKEDPEYYYSDSHFTDYWIVHMATYIARSSTSPLSNPKPLRDHVDVQSLQDFDFDDPPPSGISRSTSSTPSGISRSASSTQHDVRHRFNFRIRPHYDYPFPPEHLKKWKHAFAEAHYFGQLYRYVNLENATFSLEDLTILYRRQIAAGHQDRLSMVTGEHLLNWNVFDFETFASVASHSLTHLRLTDKNAVQFSDDDDYEYHAHFSDLPAIVSIIRNHLPNLSVLWLWLRDICGGEIDLGDRLTEDLLESTGSRSEILFRATIILIPLFSISSATSLRSVRKALLSISGLRMRDG